MASERTSAFATRRRGPGRGQSASGAPPGLDSAVQRYLLEVAQRYVPFLLVIGVLLLLVIEAPTTRSTTPANSVAAGAGSYLESSGSPSAARTSSAAGSPAKGATGNAGSTSGNSTSAPSGGGAGSAGGNYGGAGSSPADSTSSAGYSVGGVRCTPGALQVSWSPYAPPCEVAWHGNNGGATAQGVTASTITLSYREEGESSDVSAVRSIMPGVIPTDAQALYDLNVYLQIFNKTYELYGRHVVLKPYMAQGDALQELVGEDTQGAQEDAATAASLGAFADVTPIPTPLYAEALVQNHVISFNNLLASNQFLSTSAPYAYSLIPSLDDLGGLITTVGCNIASTAVSFAGDTALNGHQRVFGAIIPQNPQFEGLESKVTSGLKACGVKLPVLINYSINLSDVQSEMQNAISQMKAAHVTTLVCGCDPVGLIYATQSADQQDYYPEWASEWLPDQFARLFAQDQWAHSVELGLGPEPSLQNVEAYKVFKMADPNGQPAEPYFPIIYYQLLYLFNGLQAAGPDLTPASLLAGYQHLPPTHLGQAGQWSYGPGVYWPFSEAQLSYWDPTKISQFDGKAGDYNSCFGGAWFSLTQATFPKSLDCPGQPP